MNDILSAYLMFKVNNIVECIRILASEQKIVSKLPKQLNKVIYKYYDLYILSNKELDYETMRKKTGLEIEEERLVLFYLLIEKDIASSREFKDKELFDFYSFIVNSIIIFVQIERDKIVVKNDYSYEKIIKKIIDNYEKYLDYNYILLLDKVYDSLSKYYDKSLKKELTFRKTYDTVVYSNNYLKVKKGENLYLSVFRYKKDNFVDISRKDIDLIGKEYSLELSFIHIEMLSFRLFCEKLVGNSRKVFVELDDDFFLKKQNIKRLVDLLELRFLKNDIIFLIKTSMLEKNDGNINYLISEGLRVSFVKDTNSLLVNKYSNECYLFIDYEIHYKREVKEALNKNYDVIIRIDDKNKVSKLNNYKYIVI